MAKKAFIECELIDLLVAHFKLHWVSGFIDYLVDDEGVQFDVEDCKSISIPTTTIEMENGTKVECNAVIFFGDACMFFNDVHNSGGYHWCAFTDESISKITEIVKNKFGN